MKRKTNFKNTVIFKISYLFSQCGGSEIFERMNRFQV